MEVSLIQTMSLLPLPIHPSFLCCSWVSLGPHWGPKSPSSSLLGQGPFVDSPRPPSLFQPPIRILVTSQHSSLCSTICQDTSQPQSLAFRLGSCTSLLFCHILHMVPYCLHHVVRGASFSSPPPQHSYNFLQKRRSPFFLSLSVSDSPSPSFGLNPSIPSR